MYFHISSVHLWYNLVKTSTKHEKQLKTAIGGTFKGCSADSCVVFHQQIDAIIKFSCNQPACFLYVLVFFFSLLLSFSASSLFSPDSGVFTLAVPRGATNSTRLYFSNTGCSQPLYSAEWSARYTWEISLSALRPFVTTDRTLCQWITG